LVRGYYQVLYATKERNKVMKNNEANRVLGRIGARQLTPQEVERVSGSGPEHTNVISVNPKTGQRDGDG
jgi:hypothetical protein